MPQAESAGSSASRDPGVVGELWEVPHHFVTQVLVAAVDAAARIEREAVAKFNLARPDEGWEGLHSPRG